MFSCGLTKYELRNLTKIKIMNCVVMENIPQLFCQAIFYSSGEFSLSTLFATISSLLSVFAAGLSYFVDQKNAVDDVVAIHHYLSLECDRSAMSMVSTTKKFKGNDITEDEKGLIKLYRGWRQKLSRSLTAIWHLPDKTIEIGNTMLTANGAITHIVHLMSKQSMTGYAEELFGHSPDRTISASEIARRFDRVHRLEISKIFRSHFGLSDAFNVVFCDRISRSKRAVSAMKGSQHRCTVP